MVMALASQQVEKLVKEALLIADPSWCNPTSSPIHPSSKIGVILKPMMRFDIANKQNPWHWKNSNSFVIFVNIFFFWYP